MGDLQVFRRRIVRSNFRLLTGFSSFLSRPIMKPVFTWKNQVIASRLWETR